MNCLLVHYNQNCDLNCTHHPIIGIGFESDFNRTMMSESGFSLDGAI